jgi:hypothetical protein
MSTAAIHPYYPRNLFLPDYQPNNLPTFSILVAFFSAVAVIVYVLY